MNMPCTTDDVLRLVDDYEEIHEGISSRLLRRLVNAGPEVAAYQLEMIRRHLDERMLRGATEPIHPMADNADAYGSAVQAAAILDTPPGPRRLKTAAEVAASEPVITTAITLDDLRLLVALANTVEDVTDEEAAALNRARFRANPS